MVNINNCYVCWLNFYIYCFILIELILKVNVDELCWNWLNYILLLRNGELVMNVDKVIVMYFVIEKWWIEVNMNDLLTIDWFVFVVENDVNVEYVELRNEMRIEMLSCWWWKNLSYCDCGLEICWIGLNWWIMWIVWVWW